MGGNDVDWQGLWSQRPDLVRLARSRVPTREDAEDMASEAVLRAAMQHDLERPAAWLTTVTTNLCADLARERGRQSKREAYTRRHLEAVETPEEVACARAEAAVLLLRLRDLPARQRQAILLLAADVAIDGIAERLGVSYKAAESLISRARAALRDVLRDPPVERPRTRMRGGHSAW